MNWPLDKSLEETRIGHVLSTIPGERVRKKISDASSQIKARTKGHHPSILVLFGRDLSHGHLDLYEVRVGMFGLEQVHFVVPRDMSISPYAVGMSYGPRRKMTKSQNTSISALAVLNTSSAEEVDVTLYHNIYAACPRIRNWLP